MRQGQGSIEYLIILGVLSLVALILIAAYSGFNLFGAMTTTEARLSEIQNLLSDVSLSYAINSKGRVQASVMSTKHSHITNAKLKIISNSGDECNLSFGAVTNKRKVNTSKCLFLNGSVKDSYDFKCVLNYTEPTGITRGVVSICKGIYEQ